MPRPKLVDDAHILTTARRIFQEKGHSASTRDVANAAGISQAVLFQRFPTKEILFFAAMLPTTINPENIMGKESSMSDAKAYLRETAGNMLAQFEEHLPAMLQLITHPAFEPQTIEQAHHHLGAFQMVEVLAGKLNKLQESGAVDKAINTQAAAHVLVSCLHSLAFFNEVTHKQPAATLKQHTDAMIDVLWNGLAAKN